MPMEFKPPQPGCEFKNGKFYVYEEDRVLVMTPWPEPRAWVNTPEEGWRGDRVHAEHFLSCQYWGYDPPVQPAPLDAYRLPDEELEPLQLANCPASYIEEVRVDSWHRAMAGWRELVAHDAFFGAIPADIRKIIEPLRWRGWHLLCLLARCPDALDLYHNNPALAFALSGHWLYRESPVKHAMRASQRLVYKKQKEILAWMGFPGTETVRRMFRKIKIDELHPVTLLNLKETLKDPNRVKLLAHLPVIKPDALRLVNHTGLVTYVTPSLLLDIAENGDRYPRATHYLEDTLRMDKRLGGGFIPRRFTSLKKLGEVHDELSNLNYRHFGLPTYGVADEFPDPPYAGTDHIKPLRTRVELIQEGKEMRHCAGAYDRDVADGWLYVYKVTAPVRATLSLSCDGKDWQAREVRLFANKPVPRPIEHEVISAVFSSARIEPKPFVAPKKKSPPPLDPLLVPVLYPEPAPDAAPPWVPCDHDGHPVRFLSDASRVAVETIRSVFCEEDVAS